MSRGEGMHNVQKDFPRGSRIRDRYFIEEMLGKGGSGAVYLVRVQRSKGNLFALKEVVDANKQERQRFISECELLKRLDHSSLPHVYRVFNDDKNACAYMLMDFINGPNLEQLRQRQPEKRFSLSQVMRILAPIFDVVSYLHEQNSPIIHRDIKPANIIVPTTDDEAKLVDFGIAKEYDQDATTTAVRRCSPGYGAPEQYGQGTNPRTDIYGLGATFYTLLTGVVPLDAFYRVTQLGSKNIDPLKPVTQLVPDVPTPVANAISRAMAINSDDRFATVKEFWQELSAYASSEPSSDSEPSPAPALVPDQQRVAMPTTPVVGTAPTVVLFKLTNRTRRGSVFLLLLALLAVFALVTGAIFGTAFLPPVGHVSRIAPAAAPITRPTATQPAPTATPTTQPKASPTAVPTNYPVLVSLYKGSIHDKYTTPPTDSTMSLSQIQQNEAKISGYFSVGPGLIGNGNFTGTVSLNDTMQFLVPGYAGFLPLLFEGQIQLDGSVSGKYCSYDTQKKQCDYAGGYGDWKVSSS